MAPFRRTKFTPASTKQIASRIRRTSIPKQISNVRKSVKKIQRKEELKHLDTLVNDSTIPGSGTFYLLNGVSQGDTNILREGNEISPTSIQFKCAITLAVTEGNSRTFRHIIFWDSQPNGAAPTIGQILDDNVITTYTYAPYEYDYNKRFKIVHDKIISMVAPSPGPTTNGTSSDFINPTFVYKKKIKLGRIVKYIGTGATIASIGTNSLYSLWIDTDSSSATVYCGYRLYFKDD